MNFLKKTNKASILVFSLIILFMVLSIALGITGTTIISQKMSGTTGSSTQAFQTADSGLEIIFEKIKSAEDTDKLTSIGCSEGKVKGNIGKGEYNIIFFNENGDQLTDCNALVTEVDRVKSIGAYANTTRAVEMAVARGGDLECAIKTAEKYDTSQSVTCDSGYIAIGGGIQADTNGDLTSSYPYSSTGTSVYDGWRGSSDPGTDKGSYLRVYAMCCKVK